ncbi:hypothetical protein E2I00_014212, partial [Balaenoptera physalus]
MKIIIITAVNKMNEPIDEIFHVGQRKVVFRFLSVNSMAILAARTESDNYSNMAIIIVIKFITPRIEETPAKCKEKMAKSTEAPAWSTLPARAEFTVPLVPEPAST